MSEVQRRAQHEQQVEELCAASLRALTGVTTLHFSGHQLHRGDRAIALPAPHLHPSLEEDDFRSFRGAADGIAQRINFSDAALHQQLGQSSARADNNAADPVTQLVFELLEQIRVEALVPAHQPGLQRNLRQRFEAWSLGLHHAGHTDSATGILLYTVLQVCRARVTGEPVVAETEDLLEATRLAIAPWLGHDLAGLRRHRYDQATYAHHALAIAQHVGGLAASVQKKSDTATQQRHTRAAFSLWVPTPLPASVSENTAFNARNPFSLDAQDSYRIFTTAYDKELLASSLVRPALLTTYREQLDQRIASQGFNPHRLARELSAVLALPTRDGWDSGQEEGYIDGRRLAQLVSSPTERRLFRTERITLASDAVVGFLIDCSASMKAHIEAIAMLTDVLARVLEQIGVASEILGFTTGAWNGGRAQRDWVKAGRPDYPGRLNEACHLVFKAADTPWRRARPGIAALLKADLFREGLDGEAVQWACQRLRGLESSRIESRRILLVISDGCPQDSATSLANGPVIGPLYLDNHLKEVVQRQSLSGIEIYGVGVGLDLSPYYRYSHVIDLSDLGGNRVFSDVVALMGKGRQG